MHQRPELHQVVLERRAGDEQPTLRVEVEHRLPALTLEVFDVMGLVENEVAPLLPPEDVLILHHQLIARDADVEGVLLRPPETLLLPLLLAPIVRHNLECRRPFFELNLPVEHHRCRHYDQVRPPDPSLDGEICQHRDRHERLTQPHLVCENTVESLVVQRDHPLQRDGLILT